MRFYFLSVKPMNNKKTDRWRRVVDTFRLFFDEFLFEYFGYILVVFYLYLLLCSDFILMTILLEYILH